MADPLEYASREARRFVADLPRRAVGTRVAAGDLRRELAAPLADDGASADAVIASLARAAEPGIVASAGPRYFGFVTGGTLPAALAADWLAAAWDQNAGMYAQSPAAAVVEETVAEWVLDLLGLPRQASVGLVTGATMANFTGLAAGRHAVLRAVGWDVAEDGLQGAPAVHIVAGAEAHATVLAALRMLGFGRRQLRIVDADGEGRMRVDHLRAVLAACDGPTLVCAQAGNVNSGALDPIGAIADLAAARGAWVHVDGAFGLWAAASPRLRAAVAGIERAHSWATDGHKWLNVPYDSGIVVVADPGAHAAAVGGTAAYFVAGGGERDGMTWSPEFSRRARAFPLWAALRSLGRRGVADLVDRCCAHARRFAEILGQSPRVEILNEVVLNQVLFRFVPADGGDGDAFTRAVVRRIQDEGTCWLGGTTWRDRAAVRLSVSNWATTSEDVERSAAAILACAR